MLQTLSCHKGEGLISNAVLSLQQVLVSNATNTVLSQGYVFIRHAPNAILPQKQVFVSNAAKAILPQGFGLPSNAANAVPPQEQVLVSNSANTAREKGKELTLNSSNAVPPFQQVLTLNAAMPSLHKRMCLSQMLPKLSCNKSRCKYLKRLQCHNVSNAANVFLPQG